MDNKQYIESTKYVEEIHGIQWTYKSEESLETHRIYRVQRTPNKRGAKIVVDRHEWSLYRFSEIYVKLMSTFSNPNAQ